MALLTALMKGGVIRFGYYCARVFLGLFNKYLCVLHMYLVRE